jgi:hypothetical protein
MRLSGWLRAVVLVLGAIGCEGRSSETPAAPDAAQAVTPDGGAAPLAGGFVVEARFESGGAPTPGLTPTPTEARFIIFLDGQGMLIGSHGGGVGAVPIAAQGGGWKTRGRLTLGPGLGDGRCFGLASLAFDEMEIIREGANLRGTVRGSAWLLSGDAIRGQPIQGTFTAVPDRAPPVLSILPAKPHPADPFEVRVSEALPAGTTVKVVAADGTSRALEPKGELGRQPVARFGLDGILGWSPGLRLVVEPALADLAGNTAPEGALPAIDPVAVPLLPEDGFEGETAPYLSGGARLEREVALAGTRSLYFPAIGTGTERGGRVSLRLAVAPGDSVVRATIRAVLPREGMERFDLPLVATTGPRSWSRLMAMPVKTPLERVGTRLLSAPQTIEIPLPIANATEVMLDLQRHEGCGPPFEAAGAIIDDLRVE